MAKQYLVSSVYFENFTTHPSYEFNTLMDEDELQGTDYILPLRVGKSISRVQQCGRAEKYRLIVETVTRVQ